MLLISVSLIDESLSFSCVLVLFIDVFEFLVSFNVSVVELSISRVPVSVVLVSLSNLLVLSKWLVLLLDWVSLLTFLLSAISSPPLKPYT